MTITHDIEDYQIGAVSGSMMKLGELVISGSSVPVSYPKSTFMPYTEDQPLVSGLVRGVGYPACTWTWGVVTREERDALRTFCPGKSAWVYVRTKTMDSADSYHTYHAVMVWNTQEEERDTQRRLEFKIDFKSMVLIS